MEVIEPGESNLEEKTSMSSQQLDPWVWGSKEPEHGA